MCAHQFFALGMVDVADSHHFAHYFSPSLLTISSIVVIVIPKDMHESAVLFGEKGSSVVPVKLGVQVIVIGQSMG